MVSAHRLLVVIFFLMPLQGFLAIPLGDRGLRSDWLAAAALGGFSLTALLLRRRAVWDRTLVLLLAASIVGAGLSVVEPLMSGQGSRVVDFSTTFIQMVLGAAVVLPFLYFRPTQSGGHRILRAFLVVAGLLALFGVLQAVGGTLGIDVRPRFLNPGMVDPHGGYEGATGAFNRSMSVFEEPRQFGAYLVTPLFVTAAMVITNWWQVVSRRVAYLGAGFGLVVLAVGAVMARVRVGGGRVLALITVAAVIAVSTFSIGSDSFQYLGRRFTIPDVQALVQQTQTFDQGGSNWYRYVGQVGLSIQIWESNPVFGVGLNNFNRYGIERMTGSFGFLRQVAETSLMGIIPLGVFFLVLLLRSARLVLLAASQKPSPAVLGTSFVVWVLAALVIIKPAMSGLYGFQSMFLWVDVATIVILWRTTLGLVPDTLVETQSDEEGLVCSPRLPSPTG